MMEKPICSGCGLGLYAGVEDAELDIFPLPTMEHIWVLCISGRDSYDNPVHIMIDIDYCPGCGKRLGF